MRASLAVCAVVMAAGGCGGSEQVVTVTTERTVTDERTVTVTRTAEPDVTVYVLGGSGGGLSYKPNVIAIGATTGLTEVTWQSYGGPVARGRGVFSGDGSEQSFTLHRLVPCDGVLAYSVLIWDDESREGYGLGDCPS
jgi:hypothetical protein